MAMRQTLPFLSWGISAELERPHQVPKRQKRRKENPRRRQPQKKRKKLSGRPLEQNRNKCKTGIEKLMRITSAEFFVSVAYTPGKSGPIQFPKTDQAEVVFLGRSNVGKS